MPCPDLLEEIFRFALEANHFISINVPSHSEGRFANVTDAGRDAVDADARLTGEAEADGEVVWS